MPPLSTRAIGAIVWFASLSAGAPVVSAQIPHSEYEVKAAYLLNFSRYVEWPASMVSPRDSSSDIVICVLGRDPFGAVLDLTVANRLALGHRVRVQRPTARADVERCQVAYIGSERRADVQRWLERLRERPILTVGEGSAFAAAGGAIAFVRLEETVRFEVNLNALKLAGLRLSSRVVSLATRYYGESSP